MLPAADAPAADLPVRAALPDLIAAVREHGSAVLVAPPGSGKTSLLPLALADLAASTGGGRVVVAEPRRLATRAAAVRLAGLLGEPLGARIGYAMRGERVGGSRVRVEVVTTGLLVQRLQREQDLPGVATILVDECHERHLDGDLALAFAVDVRANLRDNLALVATSATADTARLTVALGGSGAPALLVSTGARAHDLAIVWAPPPRPLPLLPGARVDPRLLDHVAAVVRRALAETTGDVLVFLPGEAEIDAVARRVQGATDVFALFGRQSGAEQDRALRAGPRRRVVVTSAVAESSLTVPGVRVVVDAGLARAPRIDHARGLGALVTTRVSRASADQRAGRAGREGPGTVYRCWSEADHAHLDLHTAPEIATADLAGFALAVAAWGAPGGRGLALLDQPPAPALTSATDLLHGLGALDADGRITPRGQRMAAIGTHPRLARALLDGAAAVGAERAREIVALLSDDSLAGRGDDLPARWRELRRGRDGASARWREEIRRLRLPAQEPGEPPHDGSGHSGATHSGGAGHSGATHSGAGAAAMPDDLAAGTVVGFAYPDRLARARRDGSTSYLMAGGTGAALDVASGLRGSEWLAVAVADRPVGRADARIRCAAPIDEATAREVGADLVTDADEVRWIDGGLVLRRRETLGAIVLHEAPLKTADPAVIADAVREGVAASGLDVLTWRPEAVQLRARLALLHEHLGVPWPAVDDEALLGGLERWLGPDLDRVRRRSDLARIDVATALRRLLPWPAAARLEELAPERVAVPTGGRTRLTYALGEPPILALRVQEAFGWTDTPRVADGRVPVVLHLLSPAGRPVGVTSDLASFWRQGYPQVRAELRGRYPRHPWPEDPLQAPPTKRAAPRH